MLDPSGLGFRAVPLAMLPAYVGLGPGQEFIPYFFALLGLVGTALVAILQWPITLLLRRLRGRRRLQEGASAPPALSQAPLAREPFARTGGEEAPAILQATEAPEKTVDCLPHQP